MIFTIGSVLLLLTAPILGSIADKTGRQQNYLNRITIFVFLFFLLATFTTLFSLKKYFWRHCFSFLQIISTNFLLFFYNALLHHIAPREKWGQVSGIGQTGNWLGQIAGLLITLPLASGTVYLVGEAGRAQTFLPSVIIFFVLALPMLLFFKLPKQEKVNNKISLKEEYKNYWGQFKGLLKVPGMGFFCFLISFSMTQL